MEDTFIISRGERVREERIRLHLTQEECADQCGVSRVQWGKYERGLTKIDGAVLKQFSELGADAAYILSGQRGVSQDVAFQQNAALGNMLNHLKHANAMVDGFHGLPAELKEAVRDIVLAVNIASEPLLQSAIIKLALVANLSDEKLSFQANTQEVPQTTSQQTGKTSDSSKSTTGIRVQTVHGDYMENGNKYMGKKANSQSK